MIDTIRVGLEEVFLDGSRLLNGGWRELQTRQSKGDGLFDEDTRFILMRPGKSPHFFGYSPVSGRLKVETSLPKVMFGNNVRMLGSSGLPGVLDEFSNRICDVVGGDLPHVAKWDLRGRVDFVFAWRVGGKDFSVGDYLHAFRNLELSRHYAQSVDREATLYWRNKARVIRLYDKYRESADSFARGVLRFEVQVNRAKSELGFSGGVMKVGDVLNWETARSVLDKYLHGLGGDLVVTSDEKLFKGLVEAYGFARARRLFGSLKVMQMYRDDDLKRMSAERTMLWRDRLQIKRAGFNSGFVDSGMLPPLVLPEQCDGEIPSLGHLN